MGRRGKPKLTPAQEQLIELIANHGSYVQLLQIVDLQLDEIVRKNSGLCVTIARDYFKNTGFEREDLVQEAKIALWEAAKYWDQSRPFKVYAGVCIRQRLARYVGDDRNKPLPSGDQEALANTAAKEDPRSLLNSV